MDGAPHLKVISGFGVGYDYVDVPEATRRGIMVCNTPGTLTETTADQAWALLLAAARNIARGDQFVRSGSWQKYEPALLLGADVHGATLGIVGLGAIGSAVARRATGFGMRILYSGRTRKPEAEALTGAEYRPLDDLLEESDFVSLNCALTPETRGLIGDARAGPDEAAPPSWSTPPAGASSTSAPWPPPCRRGRSPAPGSTSTSRSRWTRTIPC